MFYDKTIGNKTNIGVIHPRHSSNTIKWQVLNISTFQSIVTLRSLGNLQKRIKRVTIQDSTSQRIFDLEKLDIE